MKKSVSSFQNISTFTDFGDFASRDVVEPGNYFLKYCDKLVSLTVLASMDIYDVKEYLDLVLEQPTFADDYVRYTVICEANGNDHWISADYGYNYILHEYWFQRTRSNV